jgi:hypothetical protein
MTRWAVKSVTLRLSRRNSVAVSGRSTGTISAGNVRFIDADLIRDKIC